MADLKAQAQEVKQEPKAEEVKAEVQQAVKEAPKEPTAPAVIVPEVTQAPQWHLSKEEWDANQSVLKQLSEQIPHLSSLGNALSPLVDAINDVTSEETSPIKPKPFMKRKLWGKP
jgi:hypothetical protein